jgi:hypothetical protein
MEHTTKETVLVVQAMVQHSWHGYSQKNEHEQAYEVFESKRKGLQVFGQQVVNTNVMSDAIVHEPKYVDHAAFGCNALLPLPACLLPLSCACLSAIIMSLLLALCMQIRILLVFRHGRVRRTPSIGSTPRQPFKTRAAPIFKCNARSHDSWPRLRREAEPLVSSGPNDPAILFTETVVEYVLPPRAAQVLEGGFSF